MREEVTSEDDCGASNVGNELESLAGRVPVFIVFCTLGLGLSEGGEEECLIDFLSLVGSRA